MIGDELGTNSRLIRLTKMTHLIWTRSFVLLYIVMNNILVGIENTFLPFCFITDLILNDAYML